MRRLRIIERIFLVRKICSRIIGTFFILMVFSLCQSCSNNPSVSQDEKESFINTYIDLTLAKVKYNQASKKHEKALSIIFTRNGTSREFINDFLEKIANHPEVQKEIFQAIVDRLEKYENMPPDSLEKIWQDIANEP